MKKASVLNSPSNAVRTLAMVPEKVDELLLARRNISGTHMAHTNFRVGPICINMGQAAGIAAALAAKHEIQPRNAPVKEIQDILKCNGVNP